MKRRRMNGYLLAGGILAGFLAVVILLGIFWTPYDPAAMSVGPKLDGPSLLHPMGTDNFGRDILSRVMQGAGTTCTIALATVAIGAVAGTLIGALLMAVIRNGLNLMGASNDIQYIVIGAVIILAVTIDVFRNKAEARARKMAAQ